MDFNIREKMNSFLDAAYKGIVAFLNNVMPRISESWWEDCVVANLSNNQKNTIDNIDSDISKLDLLTLLKIADKCWYEIKIYKNINTTDRQCVRDMMNVRNNWIHCEDSLPGKDLIINDLNTIKSFIKLVNNNVSICEDIDTLISYVEMPNSLESFHESNVENDNINEKTIDSNENIEEKTIVRIVSDHDKKGMVFSVEELTNTVKYQVFIDGEIQTYYKGQIEKAEISPKYNWIDLKTFKSFMTAYQINNPSSNNLYSLNSARIDFVPYQFRPALKMIHSDEPRLLIADSVGVGKTIEAGLIIKEMEARNNIDKVLIICPRPLVAERKWELEMKRFDENFIQLDGTLLRQAISDTQRDGEWPLRYSKAIVPYSILDNITYSGEKKNRRKEIGLKDLYRAPRFDLVIVDEAHHIRNGNMEKEKAFAYKCTKYFCDHADAVVMLSATPLQTGDNDLFTLLNILRPDIVMDKNTFDIMSRPNEYISKCVHILRNAKDNWQAAAKEELLKVRKTQWGDNVISNNPIYNKALKILDSNSIGREERVNLINEVESLHSFNTMINRTRRKDIQDFCVRRSHTVEVQFTPAQQKLHDELIKFEFNALSTLHDVRSIPFMMSTLKRQAASCIFGLAPNIRDIIDRRFQQINDDPESQFTGFDKDGACAASLSLLAKNLLDLAENLPEEDPKFDCLLEIIQNKQEKENNKIMLFSTFRHTLSYLKKRLLKLGYRVEQIDGSVKDEDRYELKCRFELPKNDSNAIDILLFTEVGSEGLDYQFCNMMINYDLPWNPMRIEQRIGRIDRRGQESEVVNIYNMITEGTVDYDIYYRCLMRIGVFENSIGECEEILGEIASQIEKIAVDNTLTQEERTQKLEQMADNEVRKVQELNKLEDEEKELFGFDLSEFTTAQEIKKAENQWLTPKSLQEMIEQYFESKLGTGYAFLGESDNKTLRLSVSSRKVLLDDSKKVNLQYSDVNREWESYLRGKKPTHPITFESQVASNKRDSFFITPMHPLAKQAAEYFKNNETSYISLVSYSDEIPEGIYPFALYSWKYVGLRSYTHIIPVSTNETLEKSIVDFLITSSVNSDKRVNDLESKWKILEEKQIDMWSRAQTEHKSEMDATINFKLESLENNYRNKLMSLNQKIDDAVDENIRRMYISELETAGERHREKSSQIKDLKSKADVYSNLIVKGIIEIKKAW